MENYQIPEWCKDGVLTDLGVASMITAELYISKKGVGDLQYSVLKRDVALLKSLGKQGQTPNCCKEPAAAKTPTKPAVAKTPTKPAVAKTPTKPAVAKTPTKRKSAVAKKVD